MPRQTKYHTSYPYSLAVDAGLRHHQEREGHPWFTWAIQAERLGYRLDEAYKVIDSSNPDLSSLIKVEENLRLQPFNFPNLPNCYNPKNYDKFPELQTFHTNLSNEKAEVLSVLRNRIKRLEERTFFEEQKKFWEAEAKRREEEYQRQRREKEEQEKKRASNVC